MIADDEKNPSLISNVVALHNASEKKPSGSHSAAVNSANEEANAMFRRGEIGFLEIADRVERVLRCAPQKEIYTLEDILETDRFARDAVRSM